MSEEQQKHRDNSEESPEHQQRKTMERIWDATIDTWHQATFSAGKYSKVVQKKIDLTSVHKKITTAHADLGRKIDELHQSGTKNIMGQGEIKELLDHLTNLRSTAATMEEEIAVLRSQEHSGGDVH